MGLNSPARTSKQFFGIVLAFLVSTCILFHWLLGIYASPDATADSAITDSGRALVLAPTQRDMGDNLRAIRRTLENADYQVTLFKNADVRVEHFRGDFLAQFDFVYITSHRGSNSSTPTGGNILKTT